MPELVGGPIQDLLTLRKLRRKYGVGIMDLARAGKAVGNLENMNESVAATAIALKLSEGGELRQRVEDSGRDWEEFFQGLIELLEVLIPLIIQIISLFL